LVKHSLKFKIFLCTVTLAVFIIMAVSYVYSIRMERMVNENLNTAGFILCSSVAKFTPELITRKGYDDIFEFVENAVKSSRFVEKISILDKNYRFIADRDRKTMKTRIGETMPPEERLRYPYSPGVTRLESPDGMSIEYFMPIELDAIYYGMVIFRVSCERLEISRAENRKWFVALIICAILAALAAAFLLSGMITTNLNKLMKSIKIVSGGDLAHRLDIKSGDEIGLIADQFNTMLYGLQERMHLARFVPESVLDAISDNGTLELGGHEKSVTVLFADIRGFTTLSETHPPKQIVEMLNEYLERMTAVIKSENGVVDKFIGDAIMAVFYPGEQGDDTTRAVMAGMQMMEELKRFNIKRRANELFTIDIGIGVNTGPAIVGMIGSKSGRLDYTVIGDTVNVASRLEGMSKLGKFTKIVISESVYDRICHVFDISLMDEDKVKGKTAQVKMFEIIGIKTSERILDEIDRKSEDEKVRAIDLIGLSGNVGMVDAILKYLWDESPKIRISSGMALKNLLRPVSEVVEKFCKVLEVEKDPQVMATFIKDIGMLGSDDDKIRLVPFLDHENERVRANAIEVISRVNNSPLLKDLLGKKLNDSNNRSRANAAITLYQIGDLRGLTTLIEMCRDKVSGLMRASGAYGIGQIASKRAAKNIFIYLTNEDFILNEERFKLLEDARLILEELMRDESDSMVKANIIKALGLLGNANSIPAFIKEFKRLPKTSSFRPMLLSAMTEITGSYIPQLIDEHFKKN